MQFKIGTRGSKLAMWQAEWVKSRLEMDGHECTIIPIETRGDKILDVSISKIGSKGVFTEEIEQCLEEQKIDIAVHSAKDMPSRLDPGFELIAYSERERENDVLLSEKNINLHQPIKIGTSSTRRVAFLKHYYPSVEVVSVRGNLQTRLKKMQEGLCDGLLLAYAGVHRMGYSDRIQSMLPLDQFTPAVGQGSIAIECFESLSKEKVNAVRKCVNHVETEFRLLAERAFLRTLEGGCSIPVFALATADEDKLKLSGGLISLEGDKLIKEDIQGDLNSADILGTTLGNQILNKGGRDLLKLIRDQLDSI